MILHGRGLESSEETNVIRQITMCVYDDFTSANKGLPITFDSIPSLREWVNRDKSIVSFVNRLAIVPGSPMIRLEQGILNKFGNYKLFAISRNNSFDKVLSSEGDDKESGGRHSILIKDGDMRAMWIPESQAQLILNQIKGFDPTAQPLAFAGLPQTSNKIKEGDPVRQPETAEAQKSRTLPTVKKRHEPAESTTLPWWLAACSISLLLIFTFAAFRILKSKSGSV